MKQKIGQYIKQARERLKVSQDKLAHAVGWNHHQIVSDVEQGKRELKAWELYEIARFLHVDIHTLLGQDEQKNTAFPILWRQKPKTQEMLLEQRFTNKCSQYLWLESLIAKSINTSPLIEALPKKHIDLMIFQLEHAYTLAEHIREHLSLGDFPALQLIDILESRYGVRFIVDNNAGEPSAACSRTTQGCFILINGTHHETRQIFSVAHELFHLLTWSEALVHSTKSLVEYHEKNEELANAFAAGLLIPKEKVEIEVAKICQNRPISLSDIVVLAEQFQVSREALINRMYYIRLITEEQRTVYKRKCEFLPKQTICVTSIRRLKQTYIQMVYLAYQRVLISRAKAAELLDVELCDLSEVFIEHGVPEVDVE